MEFRLGFVLSQSKTLKWIKFRFVIKQGFEKALILNLWIATQGYALLAMTRRKNKSRVKAL